MRNAGGMVVMVNARLTRGGSRNGTVKGRRGEEGRGEGREAGVESVKVTRIFAQPGFTSRSQIESAAVKRREAAGQRREMVGARTERERKGGARCETAGAR